MAGSVRGWGGLRGKGGHVWQRGGMHGKGGACVAKGGHAWQRGQGACMAKVGGMCGMHAPYEIRPVNARAVRILLECILVYLHSFMAQAFGTYRKSHADYPPPPTNSVMGRECME